MEQPRALDRLLCDAFDELASRREELEKLMKVQPCPGCGGARLRPESLAVKVGKRSLAEHSCMSVEAALETGREAHIEASDTFNEVQGRYYQLGAEVARIEQAIQHGKETRRAQQEELENTEQAWNEVQAHIKVDSQRLEQLARDMAENEPARPAARRQGRGGLAVARHGGRGRDA